MRLKLIFMIRPWLFGSLLALILAACTPSEQPAQESPAVPPTAEVPAEEIEEAEPEPPTAIPADPTDPPADPDPPDENNGQTGESQSESGVTILTGDDRDGRLSSLTQTWNTNWNRRLISTSELLSGGPPRDGIPSIDDPKFIPFDEADDWLADVEPVIALEINGDARAYPLQILTWHEIANDEIGGIPVVVTFCPLCNSAIAFDRRLNGETLEFGVSGLLRNSDLVMYDRTTETLWQQFTGEAIVGDLVPEQLSFLSTQLISYADFKAAYSDGVVLSRDTGFSRSYGNNPYGGYDTYEHPLSREGNLVLFQGEIDGRLAPAERVVTLTLEEQGVDVAYPLTLLSETGVIHDSPGGVDVVVFHKPGTASALGSQVIAEADDVGATGVFRPIVDGQKLFFSREGNMFVDAETGSTWDISGAAIEGELAGSQLEPLVHANHFWFSWAAFKPDTVIYSN